MNGEFKYEKEIRLDEERIARYYDNLPLFLDLPGENAAILERIARTSGEKVRSNDMISELRRLTPGSFFANAEDGEDGEKDSEQGDYPRDYELLDMLDRILMGYSVKYALNDDDLLNDKYLAILCQGSKTLARLSDLIYSNPDETAIRTAFAKRTVADIRDLSNALNGVKEFTDAQEVAAELDVLQIMRQKVLNIIFEADN